MKSAKAVRLSPRKLKQLAIDLHDGHAWLTRDPHEARLAFGALLMFMDEPLDANVGALYIPAHTKVLGEINGLPMALTMGMLHVNDIPYLIQHLQRLEEMRERFLDG